MAERGDLGEYPDPDFQIGSFTGDRDNEIIFSSNSHKPTYHEEYLRSRQDNSASVKNGGITHTQVGPLESHLEL